jgi:hypothetical protein
MVVLERTLYLVMAIIIMTSYMLLVKALLGPDHKLYGAGWVLFTPIALFICFGIFAAVCTEVAKKIVRHPFHSKVEEEIMEILPAVIHEELFSHPGERAEVVIKGPDIELRFYKDSNRYVYSEHPLSKERARSVFLAVHKIRQSAYGRMKAQLLRLARERFQLSALSRHQIMKSIARLQAS